VALRKHKPTKKPNILVIMGDDVGWFNIGAYHRGMMSGKTPNLDRLAAQGMMFTDYYAEASCMRVAPTSSPGSCRYVQG
jgi:arylsulfatase A-like enzyme